MFTTFTFVKVFEQEFYVWSSGLAVDCKGNYAWCPTKLAIDEKSPVALDKSGNRNVLDNSTKCLAFDGGAVVLYPFNCDRKFFFVCEVKFFSRQNRKLC